MANTHGRAVVEQLHRIADAHEGIHATHRKRVAERHALPPVILAGARTATREQLAAEKVAPRG